jgi:hypothetical protein
MRPKARGLTQHGGPPGWLEESDPAGCDFVRDGRAVLPAFSYRRLRADGISSCCYIVNVHNHPACAMSHTRKAWPGTLVDPCLLSRYGDQHKG